MESAPLASLSAPASAAATPSYERAAPWAPSLTEIVFLSVFWWLVAGAGRVALLADGDTGWHIRTGEWILAHRRFPMADLFSFSRPGAEWFAWEWLSDVILALVHQAMGLAGVTLLAAVLIAATSALLFAHLAEQGANPVVAVVVMLLAGSAATVHWLARPHLFTCLFFLLAVRLLEADAARPSRRLWLLAPLAALWANLHGGFVILFAVLGCWAAGAALGRDWRAARRCALAGAAAAAATLINPYTWRLHAHILRYLGSDFIRNRVVEFQSPHFRGESMAAFELLLLAGLLAAPGLWRRGARAQALLLVALAHAALGAVRHLLLYVLAAAPAVAREASARLQTSRNPWLRALASLGPAPEAARRARLPVWSAGSVGLAAVLFLTVPAWRVEDFPQQKFPIPALRAVEEKVLGARVFTSDQWADYLIYRYWPRQRVFLDGRSDFYGETLGRQYLEAMTAQHGWENIFALHGFDVALLPAEWPLATVLKAHPQWQLEYDDGQALMLRRVGPAVPTSANLNLPHGEKGNRNP